MADPKLRIRASGYKGSGYFNPMTGEKIIGVTTALGALEKPGLVQWAVDNTAAYAVNNIDALLSRTGDAGFRFLRHFWSRMTPKKWDDPDVDIRDVSNGVLSDLAELGTNMHAWVETYLSGRETPEFNRVEEEQMAQAFLEWLDFNDVEVYQTEMSVFGDRYGGTGDLWAKVNGKQYLIDVKTSRKVYDSHIAQLAALGAADSCVVECGPFDEGAVEYKGNFFKWGEIPPITHYGVLQLRPDDWDDNGEYLPAFCKLHTIPQPAIDAGFNLFMSSVNARYAAKELADALKGTDLE